MSNESREKLTEYTQELKDTLDNAFNQKNEIEQSDSKRKDKKLEKINAIIEQLQQMKSRVYNLAIYDQWISKLSQLQDNTIDETTADHIKAEIAGTLRDETENELEKVITKYNINDNNLEELKNSLEEKSANIQRNLESFSGKEYREKEEELENLTEEIDDIETYLNIKDENYKIINSLVLMTKAKTKETKEKHFNTVSEILNQKFDIAYNDVNEDMENLKSLKKKIKTKKDVSDKSAWFKKNWKVITAVVVDVALLGTIIGLLVHNSNKKDKVDNNNNNDSKNPSQSQDPVNPSVTDPGKNEELKDPVVLALIEKGYNEYKAKLMNENFSKETIDELLLFYRPEVEKYASCKEFNLNYVDDYELAINKYQTSADRIVDYVNRSYKVLETNFFTETTIEDIVEILYSIDNKQLFTADNVSVTKPIGAEINPILENYIFATPTENDINKLEAFKYFAKEGTDLDKFFTKAASLYQNILREPNSNLAKDSLIDYLTIYAKSLNGFEETDVLTNDSEFNEAAVLEKQYDFYIAYKAMVGPLEALMTPTYVEVEAPVIPEDATQTEIDYIKAKYEYALAEQKLNIENYQEVNKKAFDLMDLILSAINSNTYCNQETRTLN